MRNWWYFNLYNWHLYSRTLYNFAPLIKSMKLQNRSLWVQFALTPWPRVQFALTPWPLSWWNPEWASISPYDLIVSNPATINFNTISIWHKVNSRNTMNYRAVTKSAVQLTCDPKRPFLGVSPQFATALSSAHYTCCNCSLVALLLLQSVKATALAAS